MKQSEMNNRSTLIFSALLLIAGQSPLCGQDWSPRVMYNLLNLPSRVETESEQYLEIQYLVTARRLLRWDMKIWATSIPVSSSMPTVPEIL